MYRVSVLVTRRTGLSTDLFASLWLEGLVPAIAKWARSHTALRRLVVNAPPDKLDEAVAAVFPAPFDGLLEFWFDDAPEAISTMLELSHQADLKTEAEAVVDRARGVAWLAEVVPCKPESGSRIKFLAAGEVAEA